MAPALVRAVFSLLRRLAIGLVSGRSLKCGCGACAGNLLANVGSKPAPRLPAIAPGRFPQDRIRLCIARCWPASGRLSGQPVVPCTSGGRFTRNRATYVSEALVLAVQGEQRVLRTEAAVHVPERIMRQSASRIAHECFRLNYQIPPALACRRSNVDAA